MPETLREKASKKVLGPDANPSQLGDPISLKAENSDNVSTDEEKGASSPSSSPSAKSRSSKGETLREKAAKKLNGPDANPSQLGDPISLKNETSPGVPVDSERGAKSEEVVKRDSKL
ncbi:hypothetical protein E0Z10_g6715 [Xylaria hypoxylon]|uniref:Uncharacterized protein n=1 Tax=Xylaria hypoxylon TaxID=37992 RepID=A0A4Z0YFG7_9PEZI|nr:hypothetical protein E0Z10_g6715 [Xylaria hypoxylon]